VGEAWKAMAVTLAGGGLEGEGETREVWPGGEGGGDRREDGGGYNKEGTEGARWEKGASNVLVVVVPR